MPNRLISTTLRLFANDVGAQYSVIEFAADPGIMSESGTFRTSRDVRLGSGTRTKADVDQQSQRRLPIPILAHSPIEMSSSATVERVSLILAS